MQQGAVVRGIFGQAAQRVWLWNFQLQALAVEQPWERQEWRGVASRKQTGRHKMPLPLQLQGGVAGYFLPPARSQSLRKFVLFRPRM